MEWRDSMVKRMRKKRFKGEGGSIIVESAFSLPFFMFAIVIIMSFVNICSAQALITNAMNGIAADFGKISYLYAKVGILGWKEDAAAAGADVTSAGQKFMSIRVNDLDSGIQAIETLQEGIDTLSGSEDLKGSLMGALMEGVTDLAETGLGGLLIDAMMEARLGNKEEGISADQLLKHYGIQDGLNGITWMVRFNPDSKEVEILATYKVRVLDFFNLEYDYSFQKLTRTMIWDPRTNYPGGESSDE